MAEQINVSLRSELGTRQCRRLRASGLVPAILYGHGEKSISLSVPVSEIQSAVRHGSRMLEIQGAVTETALIRDVQWDAFGLDVLHVDLTRVSAEESVEVTVQVELRGEAPGSKEGGIVEHQAHEIEIACPAGAIPEKLTASINELHLGDSITASSLELPPGASLVTAPETIVASCVEPTATDDEEAAPMEGIEPEVIGRKEDDEAGDES